MKKLFLIFAVCSLSIATGAAHAAPSPNYFVKRNVATGDVTVMPYAAMCTVHAYNIGKDSNDVFDNDSALRDEMNKVVAMKSELITREMKRQYDYLDATVKRFQIQLQKAVLVAQAEAAGAPAAGSTSGGGTSLAGANNCMNKDRTETVSCLRNNMGLIQTAVNAGKDSVAVRKQIQSDIQTITSITYDPSMMGACQLLATTDAAGKAIPGVCDDSKMTTPNNIKACLPCINRAIGLIQEYQPKSQTNANLRALGLQ